MEERERSLKAELLEKLIADIEEYEAQTMSKRRKTSEVLPEMPSDMEEEMDMPMEMEEEMPEEDAALVVEEKVVPKEDVGEYVEEKVEEADEEDKSMPPFIRRMRANKRARASKE